MFRLWDTVEEKQEAKMANEFIHSLIRNPFKFKLEGNILIVHYKGKEYKFKERKFRKLE
jgi:hypothetical protein